MNAVIMNGTFLIESIITMSLFVLLNHHIMQTCPLEVKRWHVHPTIYSKSRPDAMCRSYYDCNTKMHQLANSHVTFKCDCETAYLHKQSNKHMHT